MKKHLLTRIISFVLAFLILFSDISVYAASDMIQENTEFQEQKIEESDNVQELPVVEEITVEETQEEETLNEEIIEEESLPAQKTPIKVEMEEVYYLVTETETSATAIGKYSLLDGQVPLKNSNEIQWVDRLDLTDVKEIRDFYNLLVEASDNDGVEDYLIDDSYLNAEYNLVITTVQETIEVDLSNAADEAAVKSEIEAAVSMDAESVAENYDSYIIAARDAFDRDHPEVFWLSGETALGYRLSYGYFSPESTSKSVEAEYTLTLMMVLKGNVNGETFDARAVEYQSQDAIEAGIIRMNADCDVLLESSKDLNDYEKIRYFNEVLTKSNEYNTSADLNAIAHDCRECVSALDGRTGSEGPVCEGYARALKVLCDRAGIPCVLVSGTAYNSLNSTGEAHVWNNVQLEDNWYAVDVTWNDPAGGNGEISRYENEDWLLLGSDTVVGEMTFAESHVVENLVSTNGVAFTNEPQISADKYAHSEEPDDGGENEEIQEGFIYDILDDNRLSITGYKGEIPETLEIPVEIDGYPVSAIAMGAFFNCVNLKKIEMPNSIESIGDHAFSKGDLDREIYENLDITLYVKEKNFAYQWAKNNGFKVVLPILEDVKTGIYEKNGKYYLYDEEGNLLTGYSKYDEKKYYSDKNGILQNGWIKIGTVLRYFDETGSFYEIDYETFDNYLYRLANGNVSYFSNKTTLLKNSWLTYSGARYYFDENGFAVKGWHQDGSYWYYADDDGKMANKVTKIGEKNYYFDTSYHLGTGWKKIDGVYRYFNISDNHEKCHEISMDGTKGWVNFEDGNKAYINASSGAMTGWKNLDGFRYHFNTDGFLDTGLFQDGRYCYYGETKETATETSPVGNIVKGIKVIDGKVYGFHTSSYYRLSGWQTLNGQRYYFKDDCSAVIGWYQEDDYWYYAKEDGSMAKGATKIGEKTYYFDNNYRLATGWVKLDGKWRFFDKKENYQECHEVVYNNQDGWCILQEEDGRKSYVNKSNNLLKGWQTINGQRYYFDNDGIVAIGEFKVGNNYYYAEADGTVVKGIKELDGETYLYHTSSYQRLSGWQTMNGKRFYLDKEGKAQTGFFEVSGKKYYGEIASNAETGIIRGTVAVGRKQIDGINYVFHASQYYMLSGWQTVNGQRYYLEENGSAVTNSWYQEGDYWYHADETGKMEKGLVTIEEQQYFFDNNYRLSSGWKQIDGKLYFFDEVAEEPEKCHAVKYTEDANGWLTLEDGRKSYANTKKQVLTSWQTIEKKRYFFGSNGIMETGLFQNGRYYYYAEVKANATEEVPEGCIASGAKVIDGKVYGFHTSSYYRLSGWQTLNGQRYYFKDDCSAVIGWYQEGDYWYYAKEDGSMAKGVTRIGEKTYYFDNNYRLTTGWVKLNDKWRFFDKADSPEASCELTGSEAVNGWVILGDGKKSYIHAQNGILKSWQTIDNNRYYFNGTGIAETGEFQVGNYWYYANEEGIVLKGWQIIDKKTYYFHANSYYRLTGWQTIDKQRYYFDMDGVLQTEWFEVAEYYYYADQTGIVQTNFVKIIEDDIEKLYYFDKNYRLQIGWQTIGGTKYYFNRAKNPQDCYAVYVGAVTKGWFTFDGKKSYFNSSLNAVKGWQTIDKQRYYFDTSGVLQTDWFTVDGHHYYAHADGLVVKGLVDLPYGETKETKKYYFDGNYRLKTGWQTVGGKKYFFENAESPKECYATNTAIVISSGWMQLENGQVSYVNSEGNILTGWQTIDKQRYYFDANGVLQMGWFKVGNSWYYGEEKAAEGEVQEICAGTVAKGVKVLDGKTYGFHTSNGNRLSGWQTINGQRFYLDEEGVAATGWFIVNKNRYYAEETTHDGIYAGTVAKGAKTIGTETYVFHTSSYYMLTGFQTYNKNRYYLQKDGTAKTGWFTVGTDLYYGEPETTESLIVKGTLAKGAKEIEGETYFFHTSSNYRLTGWQTVNGQRYYLDANGKAKTGWFTISGKIYYGEPSTTENGILKGTLAKGTKVINGITYIFHTSSYYRLTGWQTINGQRYYLDKDGKAKTGWFTVSGKIYYADPVLAKGLRQVGENTYYFHNSQYYRLTGWQTINKERYYLDVNGAMEKDWFTVDEYHYYAKVDGRVIKGLADLPYGETKETKKYYFDGNYRLKTGWQTVGGKKYFFENAESPEECYATNTAIVISSGWMQLENGQISYANSKGSILTGWQTIDKQRYYFDANGVLQMGWFKVGNSWYYGEEKAAEGEVQEIRAGTVAKGIKVLDGKMYGFHTSNGNRLSGWQTINGQRFYLDEEGVAATGWFTVNKNRYYAEETTHDGIYAGTVAKGAKTIGTETYIFHTSSYYMLTGFQTYNKNRYYLQKDGTAKTGWFTVGTDLYYGEPETTESGIVKGTLAKGAKEIEGETYFFHTSSNYRLTGWQNANGQKYYLGPNGIAKYGWFTVTGKAYYGELETATNEVFKGSLVKGIREIDNETYIFHSSSYHRLSGWQTIEGKKYYLQANGKAQTGWFKQNGYWYYGAETVGNGVSFKGAMEKNLREIGEDIYYFDTNYRLATGWKVINGTKHFFNVDAKPEKCNLLYKGVLTAGWFEFENGVKSYFNKQGNPLTGWQNIDGKKYYFDTNGIMQTGWQTISGKEYFFTEEGVNLSMNVPVISSLTSTVYETVDVKWNLIPGAQRYVLEYSVNNVFPRWETVSVVFTDTIVNEYKVTNLKKDTTYYFRMRFITAGNGMENADWCYSQYSEVKSIKIHGEVDPTATSASISECQIISGNRETGISVRLQAFLNQRIKSSDNQYYIVETEAYGNGIDLAVPVGSVNKSFEIDTTFVIDAGDGSNDVRECVDRALMNKFALAIKKDDGTYQVISEPRGVTNPEVISKNTAAILKPTSKKGLQGIGYAGALDTNSKNTLFNLDLATVVGTGPAEGYVPYEYKGKTYYFSDCSNLVGEFKALEEGIMQYVQGITGKNNKVAVTLNLLLSYKSFNAYLIDPSARSSGHRYYTLNMREENARETFEAVFLYLGELFGQSDCYVTHWVLGNEVNSSRAWNYQGSLSQDDYMKVYSAAFRLLYNGVKAAKTGNNVYISLDNGWTAAPDTYAGKTILDKFALYAQNENPDMLWSIAYHGYSHPLTRVDFWNDNSNTTFSTSTRYISMKNISVLTEYASVLEQKYEKPSGSIRVILSEQGYTANGKYDVTAELQARALARGYYMAEFNDRIDAFIIRAINDDAEEMKGGLYLGLKTAASLDKYADMKRITFYIYEYMDSSIEAFVSAKPSDIAWDSANQNKVRTAQNILGSTEWENIIPGFVRSKLAAMY